MSCVRLQDRHNYSAPDRGAEYINYCDERVRCLSVCVCVCVRVFVCPRSYILDSTSDLHQIFVRVTSGHISVVLWRRSDTLCTSGFMDDFIFAHKPRLLDVVAQLMEVQPTRSLGFGYKLCAVIPVAGQRTHRTTLSALKVTFQVATTDAESAVYVLLCNTLHVS